MTRCALLALAVLSLAFFPPVESSLGQLPTPPVVGMTGADQTGAENGAMGSTETELLKYGLTQGGLTIVVLVLFWWITREHKRQQEAKDEKTQILVGLVDKNTAALTTMDQTCQRLARALEERHR